MILKIAKIGGWITAVLAGLFLIAFLVLKAITDEQYKGWLESAVHSAVKRDLSIESFSIDLGTSVIVNAGGVRLANAPWSATEDMLTAKHLEVEFSLKSLFKGVAEIRLVASDVDALVESSAADEINWNMVSSDSTKDEVKSDVPFRLPLHPLIREIRFDNVAVNIAPAEGQIERKVVLKSLNIKTPEAITSLEVSAEIDGMPINLAGELGNLESVLMQSGNPITLGGQIDESVISVAGTWGPMYPKPNMDIKLEGNSPSVSRLAKLAGISLAELGALKLEVDLTASDGQFALTRLLTNLDGEIAAASISGSIENVLKFNGLNLNTKADTKALNKLLESLNLGFPLVLPPDVEVSASIAGGLAPLGIKNIVTELHDDGVEILIKGSIGDVFAVQEVDGLFDIKMDSTARLGKYLEIEIPDFGSASITGKVVSEGERLKVSELSAVISSPNINLELSGSVNDVKNSSGLDIDVKGEVSSLTEKNRTELEQLLNHFEIEAPLDLLPRSAVLSATAKGDLDILELNDVEVAMVDEGLTIDLSGSAGNVLTKEGIAAEVTISTTGTSIFSKYIEQEIPELGPVDASAKIVSSGGVFELEKFDARVGTDQFNARLSARLQDLVALKGAHATLDASLDSLSRLNAIAGTSLPDTDPISLHAEVMGAEESSEGTATFKAKASSGNTTIELDGLLGNLKSADDIKTSIIVASESLADLNQFVQQELPDEGPLSLSGTVRIKPGEYYLDDLQFKLAQQLANGNLGLQLAQSEGGVSTVTGKIEIPFLDLTPYLVFDGAGKPAAEAVSSGEAGDKANDGSTQKEDNTSGRKGEESEDLFEVASDRMFSTEPLPFDQLRLIDADFSLDTDRLKIGNTDLTDIKVTLTLKEGLLNIEPIEANDGEGTLKGFIRVDARKESALFDVDIVIDDMPTPHLGGGSDVNINLTGGGQTPAEIMGGLDGQLLIVLRDGRLEHSFATNFGTGLLSFSDETDYTDLECGIIRMDIVDGMVDFDNKLAAQLTEVNWRGGGEINLKTEKLAFGIAPKPRKGLGIGAGGFASLVYVAGTLKSPRMILNPKDVAVKYGKYMAYVSTGGLSLVAESLINKFRANIDICAQILDGTVFDEDPEELLKAQAEAEARAADDAESASKAEIE